MRTITIIFVLCCFTLFSKGQKVSEEGGIPTTYDRSSLTVFYLDLSSGRHHAKLEEKLQSIVFSDKFDNNNYGDLFLSPPYQRKESVNHQQKVLDKLEEIGAAHDIINMWYSRQEDSTMSLDLVHKRGRFSVTDSDFLKAQSTKRGNADLEDYGNRLVNLSHILVIDVESLKSTDDLGKSGDLKGWEGSVKAYLYRLDFSDEVRYAFYDTWIYDDDSEEEKKRKMEAFENLEIPINYVTRIDMNVRATQPKGDTPLGLFVTPKSEDELLTEFAQKTYDEVLYRIEMEVEEFQVVTPIFELKPIRAKIGLKEGLKTDYRFFAYEYVWDPSIEDVKPKRRGVIRATSNIVDNRQEAMGEMEASQFYQVAGRRLEEGYTLQQQNDFGVEVWVGAEVGNTGGFYIRGDYRLGRLVGVRALFAYAEGGIDGGTYDGSLYAFARYGAGFAKGLQLSRNIELRPYAGLGIEATSESGTDISSLYIRAGGNLALNLTHNFQLVGGAGYYGYFYATDEYDNILPSWDSQFPTRSGLSILAGIKIMF